MSFWLRLPNVILTVKCEQLKQQASQPELKFPKIEATPKTLKLVKVPSYYLPLFYAHL